MPGRIPISPPGAGGYYSYGQPQQPIMPGSGAGINRGGAGIGTQTATQPFFNPISTSGLTPRLGWDPRSIPNTRPGYRGEALPPLPSARSQAPGPVGTGWGVEAFPPQMGAGSVGTPGAVFPPPTALARTTAGSNNPLFGRPGFRYQYRVPASRVGPSFKGSPGTGQTAATGGNRAEGFVLSGNATEQYFSAAQFDYQPGTRADFGPSTGKNGTALPVGINVGSDGVELVGTYRVHDFTPAMRFENQMRTAGYWQDQSFGPGYRYLAQQQQVAKYNPYTQVAMSRPLSPQAYFLGYQMQMPQAARMGGFNGMGHPLGY